ncbi:DUF4185 domain-containing protein [Stieleria maiorica]|uniref:DUF4185 domain-containing protein n=1 Tax=Stieleria maiorica TaxID=2795974 RepID=UPI00142F2EC7|nr:DUF4185 domain-containing protein [Stieleria maiorica]
MSCASVIFLLTSNSWIIGEQPYPASPLVEGIRFDWTTHRRAAQGSDNFQLTWSDDDHLYGAWGDGGGFGGSNSKGRVGLGVARVEGSAKDHRGVNLWGGAASKRDATFDGKSWGMIGIANKLHMWVVPDKPPGKTYRNHYEMIELASSGDYGLSWNKAPWRFSASDDLTIPTFLNFGRGNEGVPDAFGDYVYTYFIRPRNAQMEQEGGNGVGLIVHQPGALYLARVTPDQLRSGRDCFEFFAGFDQDDQPRWDSIDRKRPVFRDAEGVGWCVSACYHPGLHRVLLCTEHGESKAGMLGIFDAPTPWGPWTTVEYYTQSMPFGAQREGSRWPWKNKVFFMAFVTKWFDGHEFTATFTGAGLGKDNDSFNTVSGRFLLRKE